MNGKRSILWARLFALAALVGAVSCDSDRSDGTDGSGGDCADYRSEYPSGPYGVAVGDVLENITGFVDGQGNAHDLAEIYADRKVVALAIANAFDT